MSTTVSKSLEPYQVIELPCAVISITVGVGEVEVWKYIEPRQPTSGGLIATLAAGETSSPGAPISVRAVTGSTVTWEQP